MDNPKPVHHSINYIEFPMIDAEATKAFYAKVFSWAFQDWGPTYVSFSGAGIDGGFNGEDKAKPATGTGVLVVLYSSDLDATLKAVEAAGGKIHKPTYEFPGGKRFHFIDPNGSELAVWSE